MNEALILEKLDRLTAEVQSLKSDVLQDLRKDLEPVLKEARPHMVSTLTNIEGEYSAEKAVHLAQNVLTHLDELNEVMDAVKAGVDFKNDMVPVIMQAYPSAVNFLHDLEGEFHIDQLTILLRKVLTNLENLGEAVDMLKAGVELRDDLVPIVQLIFPRILRFMNSLHEGEFQAEKLGDLLHTILINIHTLSDLLNMVQPMTEFVKEFSAVMQGSDVINSVNIWLDSLQQSSGMVKLAGTLWAQLKRLDYNDNQMEEICNAISSMDFSNIEPVSPFAILRQMKDPKVQTALGFMFAMLGTMGSVLQAYQEDKNKQNQQQS